MQARRTRREGVAECSKAGFILKWTAAGRVAPAPAGKAAALPAACVSSARQAVSARPWRAAPACHCPAPQAAERLRVFWLVLLPRACSSVLPTVADTFPTARFSARAPAFSRAKSFLGRHGALPD